MRYIIGIVLGIVIVFNWGSIKGMFDSKLAQQQPVTEQKPVQVAEPPPPTQPDEIVAKGMSDAAADHATN